MRPGQAAPVFSDPKFPSDEVVGASMRPGQAAPVFAATATTTTTLGGGFNEAGAGCPGIPMTEHRCCFFTGRFNEAGAGCPGILDVEATLRSGVQASMRPGQAAPVFAGRISGSGAAASLQ